MANQSTPVKGAVYDLPFTLYKSDGTVVANPGTYTKKVWKDGGAAADISGSVTETDTTYGQCVVQLSTSETNCDYLQFHITDNTTGTVPFTGSIKFAAAVSMPQTGDTYAIVNSGTYGNSALKTLMDTTGVVLTATGVTAIVTAINNLATYGLAALNTLLVTTGIKAASVPAVVVTTNNDKTGYALTTTPLDAAGVRTAVGLASANLDAQLAALPTDADVNAACDTAITDAAIPAALATAHGAGLWGSAATGDTVLTQASQDDADAVIGKTTASAIVTAYLSTDTLRATPLRRATAEVDGDWTLPVSPSATYTLVFTRDGYTETTRTVTT